MVSLRVFDVSVTRGGREVLSSVSLALEPGWTAVIGPNGAGKSTLLEVLAGTLRPDAGRRESDVERGVWVPQSVDAPTTRLGDSEDLVATLASRWDKAALRWRSRLALTDDPHVGSYGERRRWQVAAALAVEPELVLLDEPTNHLDGPSLAWLADALETFRGIGVIVSHDRAFLRRLAARVVFVEGGHVELRAQGFDDARATREQERQARRDERERRVATAKKLERAAAAKRRARDEAQAQRSTRTRMRSPKDSDARGIHAQFRADRAEAGLGRDAASVAERAERARCDVAAMAPEDDHLGDVVLPSRADAPPWLVRTALADLCVGGRCVVPARRVDLPRGARVRVAGPNGAGKSTLMHAIVDGWEHAPERLFVLPQDLDPDLPRARLHALDPDTRGRVLALVARLGSDPRGVLASPKLSAGEARKLAITIALCTPTWLLVLDEPTNHLDLPARERLEAALRAYVGAILLASHDEDFANALAHERWILDAV
ncbi:MAG: ABC-F family ATP-binding cassette domain-containing protein [Sandaracinus sp.]|nr:ABC-F family ATP-binding cassette domain-containing protein [Sandaracinus sp.]MCB9613123.1 ABC-F family ATP-binding cassette domain-containing protein [Sandaracinus sp.]MCB9636618.1 ABC-F family ATP-binding cassette domain-containing protein [Sandaracinus sp.]